MSPMMRKSLAAYAVAGSQLPPLIAVVRLYEKALVLAHQARQAAAQKKYDQHWQLIQRATAILAGLDSILNMQKGGDVAQVLRQFYRFTIRCLGTAATRRDPVRAMDAAIVHLSTMAKTWQAIAAEQEKPIPGAECDGGGLVIGASSAKESHASVIGRSMDHVHGSAFG